MIRRVQYRNTLPFAVPAVALLALACASIEVTPLDEQPVQTEDVADRNYRLGEAREVVVGQPIVQVRTYRLSKREAATVVASSDFAIAGAGFRIAGREGEEFPVRGTTELDGRLHYVVPLAGYEFFVSPEGEVHRDVKTENIRWPISSKAKIEPAGARLVPKQSEVLDTEAQYANYELIYGGTDGRSIQVTYREFMPDDSVRPSFFQSLSYDASSGTIRYRDIVVKVLEASAANQTLSYVVIADGS